MSSLIVLCPHCLTWIETREQSCTECGGEVNVEDVDPPADVLDKRLGEWLIDLGRVKLLRRGWPNAGQLIASTQGLLFVPQLVVQASGALEATMENNVAGSERIRGLLHWWSLPAWRRPIEPSESQEVPAVPAQTLRDLLFDSPGAFFIERDSMRRVWVRWGRLQIERSPLRSVSLAPVAGGPGLRESLKRLIEFPVWRSIVAEL